jgi:hypothetical protein
MTRARSVRSVCLLTIIGASVALFAQSVPDRTLRNALFLASMVTFFAGVIILRSTR